MKHLLQSTCALYLLLCGLATAYAQPVVSAEIQEQANAFKTKSAEQTPAQAASSREIFSSGFKLFQEGDFAAARIAFSRGLIADPGNGLGRFYFAEVLTRLNENSEAKSQYRYAIALLPESSTQSIKAEAALAKLPPDPPKPKPLVIPSLGVISMRGFEDVPFYVSGSLYNRSSADQTAGLFESRPIGGPHLWAAFQARALELRDWPFAKIEYVADAKTRGSIPAGAPVIELRFLRIDWRSYTQGSWLFGTSMLDIGFTVRVRVLSPAGHEVFSEDMNIAGSFEEDDTYKLSASLMPDLANKVYATLGRNKESIHAKLQ